MRGKTAILAATAASLFATTTWAQDGGAAAISTGVSYSDQRGTLGFLGFDWRNALGSGVDLHLGYEAGKDDHLGSLRLEKTWQRGTTRMGSDSYVTARLSGLSSDLEAQQFAHDQAALEVVAGATMSNGVDYALRAFHTYDKLTPSGADVSPLVLQDAGKSTATGVGLNIGYESWDRPVLPSSGFDIGADIAVATPLGDREWWSLSVNGAVARPIGRTVLVLKSEAGMIEGLSGQNVSIFDRAFIGHDAPRGFAYAGPGPRDVGAGGVDSALGGKRYFTASAELRTPTPLRNVTLGAFVDIGSLWSLDVTTGGAEPVIDDAYHLRSSVGLSAYWETNVGVVQVNLAAPIRDEDYDKTENLSLGLNISF